MYFLFKITFYHLVKQYIVLIKNENITDKSKVPLDFSLYRSSMATPSPWVASASALTCPYTEADAVSGQPHHFALHSFGPLLLGFQMPAPASLCLRDFSVATGACSAHELGKWKCYRYMISPGQLSNSD